jgi:hypothetical protein
LWAKNNLNTTYFNLLYLKRINWKNNIRRKNENHCKTTSSRFHVCRRNTVKRFEPFCRRNTAKRFEPFQAETIRLCAVWLRFQRFSESETVPGAKRTLQCGLISKLINDSPWKPKLDIIIDNLICTAACSRTSSECTLASSFSLKHAWMPVAIFGFKPYHHH